ncbi:uncharacterized protein BT62DRAFT_985479 [Guyanagaster necrorhizus]|uniref:Gfd2/YDR514C-like C-terminal domain-containing protein n=1 Tax=Guyanagaster necrorhizus TaxID=856835 RepID=A0A9P8AVH8_9AGAR|nr:uncharacterized protein BT62DRAFT_985479 [Guyanagaster necrorhizus MCA 3950]KAG7449106.1 hypothetical protein BT62DRAFT_985479 [Guyanagaster necrorhizus MCA 3950]
MPQEVLTGGYYRYTDIWFDWAENNTTDRPRLKAMLAHDSLVSPDHPLHIEGVEGVQLYMGQLHNGESRILFSSKQVDYVRYWLHAMKLTENMVPLPYSNCLLTKADLKTVSPVIYKTGGDLKLACTNMTKFNKRLKGSNPLLMSRRLAFERVRSFWAEKKGVWCAMDFEGWEREHAMITEFGWSVVRWDKGVEVADHGHLKVKEALNYRNGVYVADNRMNYDFGESQVISKRELPKFIEKMIQDLAEYGAIFLVFHDNSQDIKYLRQIEAPIEGYSHILPDAVPETGVYVVDTADLFGGLLGEDSPGNKRGLEQMCHHLLVPTQHLHNAGNDAYYTLTALKSMATEGPLDAQREKRWPNHTGPRGGVKVEFTAEEEDSDSDFY